MTILPQNDDLVEDALEAAFEELPGMDRRRAIALADNLCPECATLGDGHHGRRYIELAVAEVEPYGSSAWLTAWQCPLCGWSYVTVERYRLTPEPNLHVACREYMYDGEGRWLIGTR